VSDADVCWIKTFNTPARTPASALRTAVSTSAVMS
jgi:hypothetical protein